MFQNHMQSLICDFIKECELGENMAAVDSILIVKSRIRISGLERTER